MDSNTLHYYEQNASRLTERYQGADVGSLQQTLRRWLHSGMSVLEIDCGSERGARFMHQHTNWPFYGLCAKSLRPHPSRFNQWHSDDRVSLLKGLVAKSLWNLFIGICTRFLS